MTDTNDRAAFERALNELCAAEIGIFKAKTGDALLKAGEAKFAAKDDLLRLFDAQRASLSEVHADCVVCMGHDFAGHVRIYGNTLPSDAPEALRTIPESLASVAAPTPGEEQSSEPDFPTDERARRMADGLRCEPDCEDGCQ